MSDNFIQFHRAWIGKEEEQEVLATLRSGWLTTGERTRKFEAEFARYAGARYAVGLNSCTAGLFLSLKACGIGAGDEVITTPMTFTATANVILHLGAKPVFVDIHPDDLNINAAKIEEAITPKTRALMPVHFRGVPCDMDAILAIAEKHNLVVVEDAAHAIESVYKDRKIGSIGDATCFSFYPNKNITTGEGGMVTTNDEKVAAKIRMLSNHGLSRDASLRYTPLGQPIYEVIEPGYKFNMFDMQAAIGLHQLRKIETFWKRRKEITYKYNKAFEELPQVTVLPDVNEGKNAYHVYVLLINREKCTLDRDRLLAALKEAGIGVSVHYRALHLHKYYKETFGFAPEDFPIATDISERTFSLPLYPRLTDAEVERVIEKVANILRTYSK